MWFLCFIHYMNLSVVSNWMHFEIDVNLGKDRTWEINSLTVGKRQIALWFLANAADLPTWMLTWTKMFLWVDFCRAELSSVLSLVNTGASGCNTDVCRTVACGQQTSQKREQLLHAKSHRKREREDNIRELLGKASSELKSFCLEMLVCSTNFWYKEVSEVVLLKVW